MTERIHDFEEIDIDTKEGRLIVALVGRLMGVYDTDKTPNEIIKRVLDIMEA